MIAIKNDEKNKELNIQFQNGGKRVKVTKRYGKISLAEAMDCMKVQQKSLKLQLIQLRYIHHKKEQRGSTKRISTTTPVFHTSIFSIHHKVPLHGSP